jgi:ABC-2 type transport system ATP-binding protein
MHVRTPDAEQLRDALATTSASVRPTGPDRLEVTGATDEQIGTLAASRQIPIFEITSEQTSLEQVFLELTARIHTKEDSR